MFVFPKLKLCLFFIKKSIKSIFLMNLAHLWLENNLRTNRCKAFIKWENNTISAHDLFRTLLYFFYFIIYATSMTTNWQMKSTKTRNLLEYQTMDKCLHLTGFLVLFSKQASSLTIITILRIQIHRFLNLILFLKEWNFQEDFLNLKNTHFLHTIKKIHFQFLLAKWIK